MAALFKLIILPTVLLAQVVLGQQSWRAPAPGNGYVQGGYNDVCDSSRPCIMTRNLVCATTSPFSGRCQCKVEQGSNIPWVYDPASGNCNDPRFANQNPHHHYNNQNLPQPNQPGYGNNGGGGSWSGSGNGNGILAVGSTCVQDQQCINGLGPLSRCYFNRCQCYDTVSGGKAQVRDFEGKCWKVLLENETCEHDTECILGNPDLRCQAESHNAWLKHCRNTRNSASTTSMLTSLTLGLVALIARKIVL